MEIETEAEFDLESKDFNLNQIVDSAVDWASSPNVPHHGNKSPDIATGQSAPPLLVPLNLLHKHLTRTKLLNKFISL